MPTLAELQSQMVEEGVVDPREINRRIAEAVTAGTLTAAVEPAAEPAVGPAAEPAVEPAEAPAPRARAGYLSRAASAIQGALRGEEEPVPTYRTETERAAGYPTPTPELESEEWMPSQQQPLQYDPEAEAAMPAEIPPEEVTGPQPTAPRVRGPGTSGIQKSLADLAGEYEAAGTAMGLGFTSQRTAIGQWQKTEQEAARARAGVLDTQQREWEKAQADTVGREQERQQYVDAEMQKVAGAVNQMKTSKIDPTRFYRHPDGTANYPKSIGAIIAVGLGALGSTLPQRYGGTGGPNMALQILDQAVERDIAAQRDDIANRRAGVGLQANLLSNMREQFGDERQAEQAARIVMMETFKMEVEEQAARSGDPRVVAKAAGLLAETEQKEAAIGADMQINAAKEAVAGEEKLYAARSRQAALRAQQEAAQAKAGAKKEKEDPPIMDFVAFRKNSEKEKTEARGISDTLGSTIDSLHDLILLRESVETEMWPAYVSKNRARIDTLRQDLFMEVKEGYKLGALQKHEMKFMEKMIPDASSWGYVIPQLKIMAKQFSKKYTRKMYNRGYRPGGAGTERGETWRYAPPPKGVKKR